MEIHLNLNETIPEKAFSPDHTYRSVEMDTPLPIKDIIEKIGKKYDLEGEYSRTPDKHNGDPIYSIWNFRKKPSMMGGKVIPGEIELIVAFEADSRIRDWSTPVGETTSRKAYIKNPHGNIDDRYLEMNNIRS